MADEHTTKECVLTLHVSTMGQTRNRESEKKKKAGAKAQMDRLGVGDRSSRLHIYTKNKVCAVDSLRSSVGWIANLTCWRFGVLASARVELLKLLVSHLINALHGHRG